MHFAFHLHWGLRQYQREFCNLHQWEAAWASSWHGRLGQKPNFTKSVAKPSSNWKWCSNYYFLRGTQFLDQFTAWQWTYCFTFWSFSSPLVSLVFSFISASVNWFEIHKWGRLYNCNCLDLMSICSENWLTAMCTSVHTHMRIQTLPSFA